MAQDISLGRIDIAQSHVGGRTASERSLERRGFARSHSAVVDKRHKRLRTHDSQQFSKSEMAALTLPAMDGFTASKMPLHELTAVGGRGEPFSARVRAKADAASLMKVFAMIEPPEYHVRLAKTERGPFKLSPNLDPLTLTSQQLQKWTDIRRTSLFTEEHALRKNDRKEVIAGDFIAAIVAIVLNPVIKKAAPNAFRYFAWAHDSYISAHSLLRLLVIYYRAPAPEDSDSTELQQHVIEILSEWITVKFESLQADGKWVQTFTAFMRYLKEESKRSDRSLESVQHNAYHKQVKRAWKSEKSAFSERIRTSVVQHSSQVPAHLDLIEVPAWSLAQQLTVVDQAMIQGTPLYEYRVWADKNAVDRGKLHNICAILDVSGDYQAWVATTILVSPGDTKERARIIAYWVSVMEELQRIQNFHTMLAIDLGLNMHVVRLLRSVWAAVPKATLRTLDLMEQVLSARDNFSSYYQYLESINKLQPYIPLQSLPLKDLAAAAKLPSVLSFTGDLNWEKINRIGKVMEELRKSRAKVFRIEVSPTLQQFLLHQFLLILTETELYASTALRDEKNGRGLVSPNKKTPKLKSPRKPKRSLKFTSPFKKRKD